MAKVQPQQQGMSFTQAVVVGLIFVMMGAAAAGGAFNGLGTKSTARGFEMTADWHGIRHGIHIKVTRGVAPHAVTVYTSNQHATSGKKTWHLAGSATDHMHLYVTPLDRESYVDTSMAAHWMFGSILHTDAPGVVAYTRATDEVDHTPPPPSGIVVVWPNP